MVASLRDVALSRDDTIADNVRLVDKFVCTLPPAAVQRAGGHEAATSCLVINYINAVDAWLDRGRARGFALSTYVFTNLRHAWRRCLANEANVVHIPDYQLRKVELEVAQLDLSPADPPARDEPERPGADEVKQLEAAIAELPARERVAVGDMLRPAPRTLRQISKQLGITKEGVRLARRRGLEKLRERLSPAN